MDYRFYINDIEVEEPIGWEDFELSMRRDDKTHGIQFEASTSTLKFYGDAAIYLKDLKDQFDIKASANFIAQQFCDQPYEPIEEITGRLNFGKYKDSCGEQCIVEIPLEEDSCRVVFKNKYDQKVDLDKLIATDGFTQLSNYAQMGIELDLKAKALKASIDGSVGDTENIVEFDESIIQASLFFVRPSYSVERYNNIATGQLVPVSNWDTTEGPDLPISPQLLFEDVIICFNGNFEYNARQKGTLELTETFNPSTIFSLKHKVLKWDGTGTIFVNGTLVQEHVFFDDINNPINLPYSTTFDSTLTGSTTINEGQGLYNVIEFGLLTVLTADIHAKITYDTETFFTLNAIKICPDTLVKSYLIHETLSRVAESITNNCIRVKSNYYGRIDSQPFAFDSDGCGGLRMLTSGLKIRRAPNDAFFASIKDLFEGLNPIDNIGFDITEDPDINGHFIMNIEDVAYFYRDEEIFLIEAIPQGASEIQEQMYFSRINVGYNKWEVEKINGLDEFNSTREYSTSLDMVNNTLDIRSNLVTGSYPIEHTRQQNFADSGAADTKFDNDTFIITLIRNAYNFEVEQDNVANAANFFDPDTIYNFRLSPLRNLMRWYKTIAVGYKNLNDSNNKLFFNAGTGNFLAEGEIITGAYDGDCKLEAQTIKENQNLFVTHFARAQDYTPLWKNEFFTFEYPLNVNEYKSIKSNPYGYVSYQCGNGEFEKGFIKEIKFKPAKGKATFVLLKKR